MPEYSLGQHDRGHGHFSYAVLKDGEVFAEFGVRREEAEETIRAFQIRDAWRATCENSEKMPEDRDSGFMEWMQQQAALLAEARRQSSEDARLRAEAAPMVALLRETLKSK